MYIYIYPTINYIDQFPLSSKQQGQYTWSNSLQLFLPNPPLFLCVALVSTQSCNYLSLHAHCPSLCISL